VTPDTIRAWLDWAQTIAKNSQLRGDKAPQTGGWKPSKEYVEASRHRQELDGLIESKFKDEVVVDLFDESGRFNSDRAVWRLQAREGRVALRQEVRRILGKPEVKFTISRTGKILTT
jgi:hypothetical protein